MPSENIKGILFEYYTISESKEAYKKIDMWSKEYLQKINLEISEERYILYKFLEEHGH